MVALRDSGKAKTIGLSNFETEDLTRLGTDLSEFVVNQVCYNLLEREYEDRGQELCQKAGVGTMAYSPSAHGLLGGRLKADSPARQQCEVYQEPLFTHSKEVLKTVQAIAEELNVAPINVAVAWVLSRPNIVTAAVGSRKPEQIKQFCRAGDLELIPEHLSRLTAASSTFHTHKS